MRSARLRSKGNYARDGEEEGQGEERGYCQEDCEAGGFRHFDEVESERASGHLPLLRQH